MRIISKHKDYYDYLSGVWGIDNKVVYTRKEDEAGYENNEYNYSTVRINDVNYTFTRGVVWFCDKAYPFVEVSYKYYPEGTYFYSEEASNGYYYNFEELTKDYPQILKGFGKEVSWVNFFIKSRTEKLNTIYQSPQIAIDRAFYLKKDIILKNYDFQKIMSAEEAYQKVAMFIAAKPEPPQKIPTDMHRFEAKGFDKKTSFRKM